MTGFIKKSDDTGFTLLEVIFKDGTLKDTTKAVLTHGFVECVITFIDNINGGRLEIKYSDIVKETTDSILQLEAQYHEIIKDLESGELELLLVGENVFEISTGENCRLEGHVYIKDSTVHNPWLHDVILDTVTVVSDKRVTIKDTTITGMNINSPGPLNIRDTN